MLNLQLGFSVLLYSKKAIIQLNAITPMRGKEANQANSCFSFKCPYQATVIKILETINSPIVINPFIQYTIDYQLFTKHI